jgi:hypothetical protein
MRRRLAFVLAFSIAVTALLMIGAGASASPSKASVSKDTYSDFRMPSNNVFCAYVVSSSPYAKYLRCDIMSGIKPKPSSRGCVEGSRGVSVDIGVYGKATYECSSDTVYNTHAPKLNYGKTWQRGGFVCKSTTAGLRCSNRSAHGFFLSRGRSYRF